jgi:hypothetical protein
MNHTMIFGYSVNALAIIFLNAIEGVSGSNPLSSITLARYTFHDFRGPSQGKITLTGDTQMIAALVNLLKLTQVKQSQLNRFKVTFLLQ